MNNDVNMLMITHDPLISKFITLEVKINARFDLAALYKVETRVLNQAVKRKSKRFPS